jgi:hypothetical protein
MSVKPCTAEHQPVARRQKLEQASPHAAYPYGPAKKHSGLGLRLASLACVIRQATLLPLVSPMIPGGMREHALVQAAMLGYWAFVPTQFCMTREQYLAQLDVH